MANWKELLDTLNGMRAAAAGFVNGSYPSVCEGCDAPNPAVSPPTPTP